MTCATLMTHTSSSLSSHTGPAPLPSAPFPIPCQASDNFAERLKQQYEEKGIDGVVGAVTLLAVGASVAVTTGLVAAAEGAVDGYVAQAEAVAGAVGDAANGDFTALSDMAEDKLLRYGTLSYCCAALRFARAWGASGGRMGTFHAKSTV